MKKYYIDHPEKEKYEIEIETEITKQIIIDYLSNTYYWTIAILCGTIGFMLGLLVK